jgi:peptidoglycan hydrolase-like protein with peptidoglycan-binding domain
MFKTVSDGSKGVEVIVLQSKLNAKPPTALPALATDGIFGPKTLTRVKEFQKKNGLQAKAQWREFEIQLREAENRMAPAPG